MPSMTLFCHGTSQFSDERPHSGAAPTTAESGISQEELVTILEREYRLPAEAAKQSFNGGKVLFQGVGSGKDPKNLTRGSDFKNWASTENSKDGVSSMLRQALGQGTGVNVSLAVTILENMPRKPSVINLIGWSRGGVACIRMAQAISESDALKNIEMNIFAGDPVPGGHRPSKRTIPVQVRRYLQIYALDIGWGKGALFRGVQPVPKDIGSSDCVVVHMPGDHSQVVKANMAMKGSVPVSPGSVTKDLAVRFLRICGSEGIGADVLTVEPSSALGTYEAMYSSIRNRDGDFLESEKFYNKSSAGNALLDRYTTVRTRRAPGLDRLKEMRDRGFINEHHAFLAGGLSPTSPAYGLFRELYPTVTWHA